MMNKKKFCRGCDRVLEKDEKKWCPGCKSSRSRKLKNALGGITCGGVALGIKRIGVNKLKEITSKEGLKSAGKLLKKTAITFVTRGKF